MIEINEINGNGSPPISQKFWWAGSDLTSWLEFESPLTGAAAKMKLEALPSAIKDRKEQNLMSDLLKKFNACESSISVTISVIPIIHRKMLFQLKSKKCVNFFDEESLTTNDVLVKIDIQCHASANPAEPAEDPWMQMQMDDDVPAEPVEKLWMQLDDVPANPAAVQQIVDNAEPADDPWIQGVNQVLTQMPTEPAAPEPEEYPILKIVAVSITHGASVGESMCSDIPYATHDFRDVFFFGDVGETIYFDDPKYVKLFDNPFNPNEKTMDTLLGKDRPRCTYGCPNVYLPPIVFTLEPSHDTNFRMRNTEYNLRLKHVMGLYLYIVRRNRDKTKMYLQKLKISSYDQLDPRIFMTYSIIFDKFHRYIKADHELLRFMQTARRPLTVGFFCCRGEHAQQTKLNIASIKNPYVLLPPIIYDTRNDLSGCNIGSPRLYFHRMQSSYTFEYLHSIIMHQGQPLFMRDGGHNMYWQSCLYNLFAFFNIITRESANALASVSSFQQIRQLSSGEFLLSGESTQEAIRILNGLIPQHIGRLFIVQRSPIPLGIFKMITVFSQLPRNQVYVMFAKIYLREFVPSDPLVPSERGHWIAIARFSNNELYYIDVQSRNYISMQGTSEAVYHQLVALISQNYCVMDLLYLSTATITPMCDGPDVFNLQLPGGPGPQPGGGMRRRRHMSKKRKSKSKTKTRTKKIA